MSNVVAYPAGGRRSPARGALRVNPLLAEIVDALAYFHGHAHRDAVCNLIASRRSGAPAIASSVLRDEIRAAFSAHLDPVAGSGRQRSLIRLAFGEGSHRWSLSEDGLRLLFDARAAMDPAPGRRPDLPEA
ncbi:MAG TPA: hypothetical protein PLO65_05105 [Caulobacter sp.]|nr:hypothetical protein [Caulobacter sp.]